MIVSIAGEIELVNVICQPLLCFRASYFHFLALLLPDFLSICASNIRDRFGISESIYYWLFWLEFYNFSNPQSIVRVIKIMYCYLNQLVFMQSFLSRLS